MGAFKKLGAMDQLTLKQRGDVIVFLESQVDFEIIAQRWFFDEGATLYFQPADIPLNNVLVVAVTAP